MITPSLHFVHISDSHIGDHQAFEVFGVNPADTTTCVVEAINALPITPDFVIHTGDVVHDVAKDRYSFASAIFSRLRIPVYYASGNHDDSKSLAQSLPMGPRIARNGSDTMDYVFEIRGVRFITLDGTAPTQYAPHGALSERQFDFIENELAQGGGHVVVFIHYPPCPVDCAWIDRDMLLLDGDRLHNLFRTYSESIRGVFHGHLHRDIQVFRDGILYSCAPSTTCQFYHWPADQSVALDRDHPIGFNLVTLIGDQTVIKTVTVT